MSDSKASASVKIVDKWRRRSIADEVSICWICGSDLTDPRTLPCLHSFCSECLLVLLETYESKGKLDRIFRCPQCKTLVPNYIPEKVSPTWLRMFPTKRSIDNMKDAVNLIEEMCKPCSEKWKIVPAIKFCVDCQIFICLQCETNHKSIKENIRHKIVNYELRELRTTPASNISKFNCPQHKNLRFSTFCESHGQFLCNTCMESGQHLGCRLKNDVIETVRSITKSEAKLHVINHLKHDERNLGKDHVRVIDHIDGIQRQLEELKARHTTLYCNYVMQATVTDHKTGAMDALKGKLEFDKHHRNPEPVIKTMTKVEAILSEFTSVFAEAVDDKTIRHDVHRSINEIQKILNRELYGGRNDVNRKTFIGVTKEDTLNVGIQGLHRSHRCKRHSTVAMPEDDVQLMSKAMVSVGMISYTGMNGTAFRVGTKYVMTAAHIVRDIVDPDRTKDSDWHALDDRNVFITFSELKDEKRFWFVPQVPFLNDDLGVAVLEIREPIGLPPPLSVSTKDVPETELTEVMTVGYRLCGTLKKYVESVCHVIVKDSERAQEANNWLREEERKHRCSMILDGVDHTALSWKYDNFKDKSKLTFDMSADYRSQGSPVLIKSGNYGLKVVSILTDSVPECLTDMPTILQDRFPQEHRFESGTRMSFIYDVMNLESRFLAEDLFLVDERL